MVGRCKYLCDSVCDIQHHNMYDIRYKQRNVFPTIYVVKIEYHCGKVLSIGLYVLYFNLSVSFNSFCRHHGIQTKLVRTLNRHIFSTIQLQLKQKL